MSIGIYRNAGHEHLWSSVKGLTAENIAELQSLKVGDRLVLWVYKPMNPEPGRQYPAYEMKKAPPPRELE